MNYAFITQAKRGWVVVLTDVDGGEHYHDVKRWGFEYETHNLIPIDDLDRSYYERPNFVALLNPNEKPDTTKLSFSCKEIAQRLRNQ